MNSSKSKSQLKLENLKKMRKQALGKERRVIDTYRCLGNRGQG
jgi:hypothetical protein